MSINIGPAATDELRPRITVIGIGGAGGNAISNMINASDIEGVDFIVANTDAQALNSRALRIMRIQLGPPISRADSERARGQRSARRRRKRPFPRSRKRSKAVNMVFHRRGYGWRHWDRCGSCDRGSRAAHGCPDRWRGHQAVPVRRHAADARSRSRHRRASGITSIR